MQEFLDAAVSFPIAMSKMAPFEILYPLNLKN